MNKKSILTKNTLQLLAKNMMIENKIANQTVEIAS